MKKICIIPARVGSKRIPNKNIKEFYGKPIIAYSIELAINSNLFDEIMVSTDDIEISNISKKYGASVPFMRSQNNSNDNATTADVLIEVLLKYEEQKINFDLGCCIYPTTPLLNIQKLTEGFQLLKKGNYNSVIAALGYGHPIQRAFSIGPNQEIQMNFSENEFKRTQDFQNFYHDAGQFYWFNKDHLMKSKSLLDGKVGAVIMNELETQDIDTITDWKLTELKYKLKNNEI